MLDSTASSLSSSSLVSPHSVSASATSATRRFEITAGQRCRRLADHDGTGPEALDHEAELLEPLRLGDEAVCLARIELNDLRHQQNLPGDARRGALGFEPLVDEALVRRVLIDDDDAVLRLRHDVVLVQLRAGGAEGLRRPPGPRAGRQWRARRPIGSDSVANAACGSS